MAPRSRAPRTGGPDDRGGQDPPSPKRGSPPRRKPRPPEPGEPEVFLDVELCDGCFWLVLENPSPHPAYDVTVTFGERLIGRGGDTDLARLELFRGLSLLRPGREIRIFLDVARLFFGRKQDRLVEVEVSWRSREGTALAERFRHDLSVWADLGEIDAAP